ncbi:MAG: hypothetical protein LBT68_03810 [Spirochaetales bacterium]|jgi:hypothetical protein|nr:hypothetical protein [Spirochaetales bacterium]
MKKVCMTALSILILTGTSCTGSQKSKIPGVRSETHTTLRTGSVHVYDFGALRLHAYNTNGPTGDEVYLLETGSELIGIESPAFFDSLSEYADYIASIGKPLNHLILPYHPAGGETFTNCRVYKTKSAQAAGEEGGSVRALVDNFIKIFGNKFAGEIPVATDIIPDGKNTIGSVEFIVTSTADGFDLEIPAINCVYTHMVGKNTHNILITAGQIDAMIKQMKGYSAKRYSLILTTHDAPQTIDSASDKAGYLGKARELLAASKTRDEFISQMKNTFPDYAGEHYLEMSAMALFPS